MFSHPIIVWFSVRKGSIEILIALLVVTSALLNYFKLAGSQEALMITMSLLSGFYFLSIYFKPEIQGQLGIIAIKVFGIASAVCVVGLLYAILHLVGATEMLLIGVTSLAGALLIGLYQAFIVKESTFIPLIIRSVILIIISGSAFIKLSQTTPN
jgi:hypothetical protein